MSDTAVDTPVVDEPEVIDLAEELPTEPERVEAPVKEILPIILLGDWVRLGFGSKIPTNLRNRVATVTSAPVHTAQGMDNISDLPYQYQRPGDVFNVRVRETGDVLTDLVRADFVSHGPTENDVARHMVTKR